MQQERLKDPNFKEQGFRERQNLLNKDPEQTILEELEGAIGEDNYKKIWHFFKSICAPPLAPYTVLEQTKAFITRESMMEKFPVFWGHECVFLKEQLFRVLSNDCSLGKIYFKQFIEKFYQQVFNTDSRVRQNFVFRLLDTDMDGVLKAKDLTVAATQVNCDSKFG